MTPSRQPRPGGGLDSSASSALTASLSRGQVAAGLVLVLLTTLAAYATTFRVPFLFDDQLVLQERLLQAKGFSLAALFSGRRSVGDLSFVLNYRLHGLSVAGYHLVNLLVHLANGLLVYLLVTLAMASPRMRESAPDAVPRGRLIGLIAAIFFLVHPLQTQAVTYIVQRYTSLATFFYLGALTAYAGARLAWYRRRWLSPGLFLLALVAAFLAMKTKEIAFTLPGAVILFEAAFLLRGFSARRLFAVLATLAATGFAAVAFLSAGFSGSLVDRLATVSREDLLPRSAYLFTQLRVIVTYIRLLFLPVNQRLEYDYPVYRTFFTPPVVLSTLVVGAMLLTALWCWRRSGTLSRCAPLGGGELRLVSFGIFWFFLTLLVESSIIPIADVIFEHRVYLPSVGAGIAVAAALVAMTTGLKLAPARVRLLLISGVCLAALILSVATFRRNRVWATEESLWTDTVTKSPGRARAWNNLGSVYIMQNEPFKALAALERADRLAPGKMDTLFNIALAFDRLGSYEGRYRNGAEMFDGSGRVKPQYGSDWYALAHNNVGLLQEVLGQKDRALAMYREAIRMSPRLPEPHLNLGLLLVARGDLAGAEEQYRQLAALNPDLAAKMLLWARAGARRN